MRHLLALALAAAGAASRPGCIRNSARRGIEPVWMELDPASFVVGTTTRADVLDRVGVPSQVLALEDGTALYYLLERSRADGAHPAPLQPAGGELLLRPGDLLLR